MPFARPTLSDLRDRARRDVAARLPGADPLLRFSNFGVVADAFAGLLHLQYGFLDRLARQVIPDTAESAFLDRWTNIWGIVRRAASAASGTVTVTGTAGAAVPVGAELITSGAAPARYRATAGVTLTGSTAAVPVEAVDAGVAGNLAEGGALTFASALSGVDAAAVVAAGGLAGGADAESDEDLRDRFLARLRLPPQGGAPRDYVAWALGVAGVTRVWVYRQELGIGTVTVRFMMDDAYTDGIPQGSGAPSYSGDVQAVFEAVEPLRPVTAELYVEPPIAAPLDLTIADLTPDTPAVRAAVEAELADMLFRLAVPAGSVWDEASGTDVDAGTIRVSWIWEAVAAATGERSHRITAPAGDVAYTTGQIAVLGTVTYV